MHQPIYLARTLLQWLFLGILLCSANIGVAQEKTYRVALISNSPPLSYTDAAGKFTGFNVEMAHELCATMKIRCSQVPMPIDQIIEAAATDQVDFAVVGFLPNAERRMRVLFSKEYFRSFSVWLARPSVAMGDSRNTVAVIRGSAQAAYVQSKGWKHVPVSNQMEMTSLLAALGADAAVLPMLSGLSMIQEKSLRSLKLQSTVISDPPMNGTLHMVVNPKQPELAERVNAAIDQVKRDGRFNRINLQFVPFSLQ
jgi:ABC-type amino acid transport substrate-binding protein